MSSLCDIAVDAAIFGYFIFCLGSEEERSDLERRVNEVGEEHFCCDCERAVDEVCQWGERGVTLACSASQALLMGLRKCERIN